MTRFPLFLIWVLLWTGSAFCAEQPNAVVLSSDSVGGIPVAAPEPFVWPVAASVDGKTVKIVSLYGHRKAPVTELPEDHEGVDFSVPVDTVVRTARSGKVLFAGFSKAYVGRADAKEQSRLVIIQHIDGQSTRYVHLNRVSVRPGQQVTPAQAIGTTAESDEWTEPVLHFEIRDLNGKPVNPLSYFTAPEKKRP